MLPNQNKSNNVLDAHKTQELMKEKRENGGSTSVPNSDPPWFVCQWKLTKKICSKICREEKILVFFTLLVFIKATLCSCSSNKDISLMMMILYLMRGSISRGKTTATTLNGVHKLYIVCLTDKWFVLFAGSSFSWCVFCSSRTGRNTLQTAGRCVYVLRSVTGRIQWAMCITTDEIFKLLSYYRTIFFQAFRVIFVSYSCDVFHYAHDLKCHPVAFFSLSPECLLFVKLVKLSIKKKQT